MQKALEIKIAAAVVIGCLHACSGGGHSKGDSGADSGQDAGSGVTPRLIAPLSTAMVRELSPTLRWTGGEGDVFTLEVSPSRQFEEIEYSWSGSALEHEVESELAQGSWFWRVSTPDPQGGTLYSHVWMIVTGKMPYDVNGDGYSDILLGTFRSELHYVFWGGPGLSGEIETENADVKISNLSNGGYGCTSFSDIDGDGFSDIVIGMPDDIGNVFVCSGYHMMGGLGDYYEALEECDRIKENEITHDLFGGPFSSKGDIDGDGRFDLAVSAIQHSLNAETPYAGIVHYYLSEEKPITDYHNRWESSYEFVGVTSEDAVRVLDIPRDINGDGFSEIMVGSPAHSMQWWIVFGHAGLEGQDSPQTADLLLFGSEEDSGYPNVKDGGDIDGDGYGDLILFYMLDDSYEYEVVVLGGGSELPAAPREEDMMIRIHHPAVTVLEKLNTNLFGPGDVNGDGYDDIGFTRLGNLENYEGWDDVDPLGAIYIVYGGPDLPLEMDAEDADVIIAGNGDPWFGEYASGVGDVNGDGLMDFGVSATGDPIGEHDLFPGRVFVFFGGPTLEDKQTADDADLIISSTIPDESLGMCINRGGA